MSRDMSSTVVIVEVHKGIVCKVMCNDADAVIHIRDFDVPTEDEKYGETIFEWPNTQMDDETWNSISEDYEDDECDASEFDLY